MLQYHAQRQPYAIGFSIHKSNEQSVDYNLDNMVRCVFVMLSAGELCSVRLSVRDCVVL